MPAQSPYKLPGINTDTSNAYYYPYQDSERLKLPIAEWGHQGDTRLSPEALDQYFQINDRALPLVPRYFIVPRLDSRWDQEKTNQTGMSWWRITGSIVVYEPKEWVPVVQKRGYRNMPLTGFDISPVLKIADLYGGTEQAVSLNTAVGIGAMKVELVEKSEIKARYINGIRKAGRECEFSAMLVAAGLAIHVKRVAERPIDLLLNDAQKSESLTWGGPDQWTDVWVPSADLRHVSGLQFTNIKMTGGGHSESLLVQVLPVFGDDRTLKDLHVVVSCKGWDSWYAYREGKLVSEPRLERLDWVDDAWTGVALIPLTPVCCNNIRKVDTVGHDTASDSSDET